MKGHSRRASHQPKATGDQVVIEPGAEKRLTNILKKALSTPPPRHVGSQHTPKGTGRSGKGSILT
jgi:hypothetical protein